MSYGLYTGAERSYFPGVVAAINALRHYGCTAPVAVLDFGLEPWMSAYLRDFERVEVFDLRPLGAIYKYSDIDTEFSPALDHFAFKAFGIVHFDLFESFTYFDADYLPLCNLEEELRPRAEAGAFLACEDGENDWNELQQMVLGAPAGKFLNINAGFFSLARAPHGRVMRAWRDLLRSRLAYEIAPFQDQGVLNAVLDKFAVKKTLLDKQLWNQTRILSELTQTGVVGCDGDVLVHLGEGERIYGWHAMGAIKLWHQIGIDHRPLPALDRLHFCDEARGFSPRAVVRLFEEFLFMNEFNRALDWNGLEVVM